MNIAEKVLYIEGLLQRLKVLNPENEFELKYKLVKLDEIDLLKYKYEGKQRPILTIPKKWTFDIVINNKIIIMDRSFVEILEIIIEILKRNYFDTILDSSIEKIDISIFESLEVIKEIKNVIDNVNNNDNFSNEDLKLSKSIFRNLH